MQLQRDRGPMGEVPQSEARSPFAASGSVPGIGEPAYKSPEPMGPRATGVMGPVPGAVSAGLTGVTADPQTAGAQSDLMAGPPVPPVVSGRVAYNTGTPGPMGETKFEIVTRERQNPMTVGEGVAAGIVQPMRPLSEPPEVQRERPGVMGLVDRLRKGRDEAMTMTGEGERAAAMDATRTARWGLMGGGGPTSVRTKQAEQVLAGEQKMKDRERLGQMRVAEAQRTPQAAAGGAGNSTYDPATGKWTTQLAERGAAQKVPETMGGMDDKEVIAGMAKFGKPKLREVKELDNVAFAKYQQAKTDEERRKILEPDWTPDDQAAYAQYRREAARRGLIDASAAGAAPQVGGPAGAQGMAKFYRK